MGELNLSFNLWFILSVKFKMWGRSWIRDLVGSVVFCVCEANVLGELNLSFKIWFILSVKFKMWGRSRIQNLVGSVLFCVSEGNVWVS